MSPERWLQLKVRGSLDVGLVSSLLLDLGGTAVEESEEGLLTYLTPPDDLREFLTLTRGRLQSLAPGVPFDLTWKWQAQEDWEILWRRGLGIRRITPRLVVSPSWEEVEPSPGEIVIKLDPGLAFGTAEHATTRGCLRVLDVMVTEGSRIADVGSGSGILSIAAARLGATRVLAMETDGPSCETALRNLHENGVQARVRVLHARAEPGAPLPDGPFDGIVANLQSHLIFPLLEGFRTSLDEGGWLILSGILSEEREAVLTAASDEGFLFLADDEEDGWWTGVFRTEEVGK
jgi:ribosomal protein L11 methyltransferase